MAASLSRFVKTTAVPQSLGAAIDALVCITCLTCVAIYTPVQAACPSVCSCSAASGGGQTVSCSPGMSTFPLGLPSDTTSISLSPLPSQTQNSIPVLTASNFRSTTNLTWITIRRSNVQQIGPSAFSSLTKLLGLDLRDNRLQHVARSDLAGLTSLVTLDISDNRRCVLDADTFMGMTRLRVLRLANIGLDTLGRILNDLTSLVHLDLHGNNLFRLRGTSVTNLRNLRHLDISGNDLYGIDEDAKPILSSLAALDLDLNPWRCNCALTWLKSMPRKFVAPSGGGRMPVVCGQPSRLAFKDVWDVQDFEMTCSPAKVSSCTGPITVWEGDQISITCDVGGDPFPDVTCYRPDGTQVQTDVTFATADAVTLTGVRADYTLHHGAWTVRAVSYNTTASMSVQVTVLTLTTQSTAGTSTTPTHSKHPSIQNNLTNLANNNNNNNNLNPTSRPTLAPGSGPLTYPGGRPVSPKSQASITTSSSNSGGNGAVLPTASTASSPSGKQQPTPGPQGNRNGGATNNRDSANGNSNSSNGKNDNKGGKNDDSDNDYTNASDSSGITHNTIVLVAIVCGSVVSIVGMTLFALTAYKIRQKRQIHARRRRQSAELYRYNGYGNGGTTSVERSPSDMSFFLRPPLTGNAETASVQNVSTVFASR